MTDWQHAVEKLTRPWSDVLSPDMTGGNGYMHVNYPPLLDMLDEACRANNGERSHGSGNDPASRSLLDLQAFMLREQIDGTVRAWISHLSKSRAEKELKPAVVQLANLLTAHHAARTVTDSDYTRLTGFFPRWCEQVWVLFDPPIVRELLGACPNPDCEQTKVADVEGVQSSALVAFYARNTGRVQARCRACSWEWNTDTELALLGQQLGAEQDVDFLKAVGL